MHRCFKFIVATLVTLAAVRLVTLGLYPLGSTTEPRYAEIARKMLATGNWITPWFDHGVPFWGKPPLSFWASAATMAVFGVNEFGARLAPFLASVGVAAFLMHWQAPLERDARIGWGAALVFGSSLIGFIASAAVMTDVFMTLGTTLSMVGFWRAVNDPTGRSPWRWAFHIGLAVGLLAKGPVAVVLTGVALMSWLLTTGRWREAWQRLAWGRGLLLAALLALPWYALAEWRTPGFLRYFIIGEHFERFVVSGWTGDLYGQGHPEPRGMIWLFALAGFMPWVAVLPLAGWLARRDRTASSGSPGDALGEWRYLAAWVLAPLLFFTASRNILQAYVLPGLPAFAVLVSQALNRAIDARPGSRARCATWALGLLAPLAFAVWLAVSPQPEWRSQKALLAHWTPGTPLAYLGSRPLSANFYSRGQALDITTATAAHDWLLAPAPRAAVVEDGWLANIASADLAAWRVVARHAGYTLMVPAQP